MKTWNAVVTDEGEEEPWDWKFELELSDDETKTIHEVIYVTFTGTIGDDDEVIAAPKEMVEDRVDAMLKGLNRLEKAEQKRRDKDV